MALAAMARPKPPNMGRECTGCGVGMEALGSPIMATAMVPIFSTMSGFTPKKAGDQITVQVYPDAGHAFANATGTAYNAKVADDARGKTLAFFRKHLK